MKNYLEDVLFLVPIVAIFAIGIAIHYITKTDQPEPSTSSSNTTFYNHTNTMSNLAAGNPAKFDHYAMLEPFAENHPFNFSSVMQQPMNPAAWMQMMTHMMNYMSMNQMMHQMAAMPMQMMNPTLWMDPHAMLPNSSTSTAQQPMSPDEYRKWYEQHHSQSESNK